MRIRESVAIAARGADADGKSNAIGGMHQAASRSLRLAPSRQPVLSTIVGGLRSIAFAALFLTAGTALAQSPQPYIKYIPSSGDAPDTAEMGTQIVVYGSNFCQTGCSPVTLTMGLTVTVGSDVSASFFLATVQVNGGGTFAQPITVNVPFPWRYLITATQTTATGAMISASVPIIVPAGDYPEENAPPGLAARPGTPQNQPLAGGSPDSNPIRNQLTAMMDPPGVTEYAPTKPMMAAA